jgi:hypothetical protein
MRPARELLEAGHQAKLVEPVGAKADACLFLGYVRLRQR